LRFGLEVEDTPAFIEGEFLDTVIGIPDARTEIVMLRRPTEAPGSNLPVSTGPRITRPDPDAEQPVTGA